MNKQQILVSALGFFVAALVSIAFSEAMLALSSFFYAFAVFAIALIKTEDNRNTAIIAIGSLLFLLVASAMLGNFQEFIDAAIKTSAIAVVCVFALYQISKNTIATKLSNSQAVANSELR